LKNGERPDKLDKEAINLLMTPPEQSPNPQAAVSTVDEEAARLMRSRLIMGGALILLLLPLIGVIYIQMKKGFGEGNTPGENSLSVFEQRAGRQKKTIAPSLAPALALTNNLTEQIPKNATLERQEGDSLNFLRGGQDYRQFQPMKGGEAEIKKVEGQSKEAEKTVAVPQPVEEAAPPVTKKAVAKGSRSARKPFRGPKLKSMKSNFGAPGSFRDNMPGSEEKEAGAAPAGMPPGMDMGAMMKMAGQGGGAAGGAPAGMPPGMDMGAMMKQAQQGTAAQPSGQ
jgi:hypothetical protein